MTILLAVGAIAGCIALLVWGVRRMDRQEKAKNEAYFVSMFPELQPYFHPAKVLAFARARLAGPKPRDGAKISNPAGFGVNSASVSFSRDKKARTVEAWRLLDEAGRQLAQFTFDADAKDAIFRVGVGKLRADLYADRVRYWHPDREFKWRAPGLWTFVTRVFERPVSTTDDGALGFSDSSSSGSRTAATAAAVAGIVAAGGTFDGGGASAAWDGRSGGSPDSEGATAGATSY
jgi:hypothetical protein